MNSKTEILRDLNPETRGVQEPAKGNLSDLLTDCDYARAKNGEIKALGEPDWWSYEDNDPLWIAEHEGKN